MNIVLGRATAMATLDHQAYTADIQFPDKAQ